MHPQVLRARLGFDAEREKVSLVRAVSDQEGAAGFGIQLVIGFFAADGAPVEAALLELPDGTLDHLILKLGAECLVTLRLQPRAHVKRAAAHCDVELAVCYHGAQHKTSNVRNTAVKRMNENLSFILLLRELLL